MAPTDPPALPPPLPTSSQTRADLQDARIDSLSPCAQLTNLSKVGRYMKEVLTTLPKTVEHLVHAASVGKKLAPTERPSGSGSVPPFIRENHFDSQMFSLPKVKLPQFDGTDSRGWITKRELYLSP